MLGWRGFGTFIRAGLTFFANGVASFEHATRRRVKSVVLLCILLFQVSFFVRGFTLGLKSALFSTPHDKLLPMSDNEQNGSFLDILLHF